MGDRRGVVPIAVDTSYNQDYSSFETKTFLKTLGGLRLKLQIVPRSTDSPEAGMRMRHPREQEVWLQHDICTGGEVPRRESRIRARVPIESTFTVNDARTKRAACKTRQKSKIWTVRPLKHVFWPRDRQLGDKIHS